MTGVTGVHFTVGVGERERSNDWQAEVGSRVRLISNAWSGFCHDLTNHHPSFIHHQSGDFGKTTFMACQHCIINGPDVIQLPPPPLSSHSLTYCNSLQSVGGWDVFLCQASTLYLCVCVWYIDLVVIWLVYFCWLINWLIVEMCTLTLCMLSKT